MVKSERPRILALFGAGVLFGQERGNIEALAALMSQGCEVLCLVRNDAWSTEIPAALAARGLVSRKVSYIEQRMPGRLKYFVLRNPFAFALAQWQFWRVLREYRPTHIYAFNSFYVLNFLPTLALTAIPVIYRAGDEPTRHNIFFRWTWSFVVARTSRFVANSKFIAQRLIAAGVAAQKVTIIYSKPPERSPSRPFTLPADAPRAADGFRIVYVGQLTADKGVHVLIEAFRELATKSADVALFIAGRISDWEGDAYARALVGQVEADPALKDRVKFLGYVEDIRTLLDAMHVHVAPSLFEEPLANVVMEAKEAGLASIVFPSGGLPEMIENGVDGIVCAQKSPSCLVKALSLYANDHELVKRHGRAAHASLQRFDFQSFAVRWRANLDETSGMAHDQLA